MASSSSGSKVKTKGEVAMKRASQALDHLPSNEKIDKTMEHMKKEVRIARDETPGIDSTGRQILRDTENVIDSAQAFIQEKNDGDRIQKLLKEGKKASKELKQHAAKIRDASKDTAQSMDAERLRKMAERTLETARLAALELVSSQSFRNDLIDFFKLAYDIAQSCIVDNETYQAKRLHEKKGKRKQKRLEGESSRTYQQGTSSSGAFNPPPAPPPPPGPGQTTTYYPPSEGTQADTGGKDVSDRAKQGLDKVNKRLEKSGYNKRVHLSKQQLDDLVDRFLLVLSNVARRERAKRVVIDVLDLIELFSEQIGWTVPEEHPEQSARMKEQLRYSSNYLKYNKHVRKSLKLSQELIEQFTGGKSLDPAIKHLNAIGNILRRNTQAQATFEDLRTFMLRAFEDPSMLQNRETPIEIRRLIKRVRKIQSQDLYSHFADFFTEVKRLIKAVQQDPATARLRRDMKKLVADLMLDEEGNFVIKSEVIQQLRLIILNSVFERMKIPLPAMHSKEGNTELSLSNMVLAVKDLVPEKIVIEDHGVLDVRLHDVHHPEVSHAKNIIKINIQNINVHMKNVDVNFTRSAFPRVNDGGHVRVDIGGRGMDIVINIKTFAGGNTLFRVDYVDVDVHRLNMNLSDTRHDFLYGVALKLMKRRIKRNIEQSIENTLRNQLEQINRLAVKQVNKARKLAANQVDRSITGPHFTTQDVVGTIKRTASALAGV